LNVEEDVAGFLGISMMKNHFLKQSYSLQNVWLSVYFSHWTCATAIARVSLPANEDGVKCTEPRKYAAIVW